MSEDDELLQEFLVESRENLDRLERELVAFERQGASGETLAAIFRTVHTVKGTAGFFGFERLQRITHTAESLLARIRDGQLSLTGEMVTALLAVVDACRTILHAIEARRGEGEQAFDPLVARLAQLQGGDAAPVVAAPIAPPPAPVADPAPDAVETTVRVDVGLLDKLMDLAGELVLARNQMLQLASTSADHAFVGTAQRLDLITSELQDGIMRTRMQPIGGVWGKLPRVVRDLAGELGKKVRLELEGKDTGLDRSILEAIKDPLTHLVRNAVDHGIESPERRAAAGKAAEGVLRLRAGHEGGQVMLEIADDGGGVDPERVRRRAVERGVVPADRAARMTDAELIQLLFAPGFSTAEQVTSVSGRGVGMDVVKTNIEKIGGVVELHSEVGQSTTVRLKIPLTLAIIPALIVVAGDERFAIPQLAVVELVRIDREGGLGVELVHGAPLYRRRGKLLPLVYLTQVLGGDADPARAQTIVVAQSDHRQFGLVVDGVHDTEEIVVKPLGKRLSTLATYAGATILGDGQVALILDVRGIAARAGLEAGVRRDDATPAAAEASDARTLLVVRAPGDRRLAVPLTEVARLEEFAASSVERAGAFEVVQYRDRMLPLVRLGDLLGYGADGDPERVTVIVHSGTGRDLGLVVDGIVDIVEQTVAIDRTSTRDTVLGSAVVQGRVTDLIDVAAVASAAGLAPVRQEQAR